MEKINKDYKRQTWKIKAKLFKIVWRIIYVEEFRKWLNKLTCKCPPSEGGWMFTAYAEYFLGFVLLQ